MTIYRVEFSPEVEHEILDIASYIANDSLRNAERWIDGVYWAIDSLKRMPGRCGFIRENDEFEEDLRELRYKSHRIIFVVDGKTVRVLHIRHVARDEWKG